MGLATMSSLRVLDSAESCEEMIPKYLKQENRKIGLKEKG